MIKVNWDVEELVALIDVYRSSGNMSAAAIEENLSALAERLVKRADKLGIAHDEKFRNLNGRKMMFQNVVFIATEGKQGLSAASSSMQKVYSLLLSNPEVFEMILAEFNRKY